MNNLNLQTSEQQEELIDSPEVNHEVMARITNIRESILASSRFVMKPGNILDESLFESMIHTIEQELRDNPDVLEHYDSIVIQGNRKALEEKTKLQIKMLRAYLLEHGDTFEGSEETFRQWVGNMNIVRNDENADKFGEFLSPRQTGNVKSFNRVDSFVQADRFVYASLDGMPHPLTGFDDKAHTQIDEEDVYDRAEIAMMDVDALKNQPRDIIRNYANNLFDFHGGKEIISLYLAAVFRSPEEASFFHRASTTMRLAQYWKFIEKLTVQEIVEIFEAAKQSVHPASLARIKTPITQARNFKLLQEANIILEQAGIAPERVGEIFQKIFDLKKNLGLVPPLSLEVKIKDSAKIQKNPRKVA